MEYDIFISYSHRDNLVLEGKSHGWIARFHVALDYHLTNFLGRKPNIFRDVKIEGYQRITPSVYAALDRSLLFLPVLSPNFLTSEWCPDELDYFFDRVKSKDANRQVFSVVKTPIETVPDKLKDHLLKFEYFQEGNLESEPLLQFNPDFGEELGNRFHLKTSDLARRMASYIKGVSKKGVVSNPPANDECIYLAEPSPDLWEAYEDIKRDLEQRGTIVLPQDLMKDAPKPPAEIYRQTVSREIGRCRLSVNLVGSRSNGYPKKSELTYQQIQMAASAERDGASDYKRLIWLPKDIRSDDEDQQKLIDEIRGTSTKGVEFLQGSLEEFKTSIQDALKPQVKDTSSSEEDEATWVYVLYDRSDMEPARQVEDFLQDKNLATFQTRDYLEPAMKGDLDGSVYEKHQEWLSKCDAVLIYWNLAPTTWVINNIYELQKAKAARNGKKFRAKAILCDGDAESDRKNRFKSPMVLKVQGLAELPLFLSRLEVQFP